MNIFGTTLNKFKLVFFSLGDHSNVEHFSPDAADVSEKITIIRGEQGLRCVQNFACHVTSQCGDSSHQDSVLERNKTSLEDHW